MFWRSHWYRIGYTKPSIFKIEMLLKTLKIDEGKSNTKIFKPVCLSIIPFLPDSQGTLVNGHCSTWASQYYIYLYDYKTWYFPPLIPLKPVNTIEPIICRRMKYWYGPWASVYEAWKLGISPMWYNLKWDKHLQQ